MGLWGFTEKSNFFRRGGGAKKGSWTACRLKRFDKKEGEGVEGLDTPIHTMPP